MSVSFAEEADVVVGIDLSDRFAHAGTKLAEERQVTNIRFVQADGSRLPFPTDDFNLVFSHAVIEHVSDPGSYLREARRVLRPGGRMLLQTAPYLSPSGVHLPRLKVPVPIHLLIGRPAAFRLSCWLAKHAPSSLQASHDDSAILAKARRGEANVDDLTYLVTLQNLRRHIADAGFAIVREDLEISKLAQRMLPEWLVNQIPSIPLGRDVLITNMEYLLA
jgi:SAM-dependent methyltransferase